MKTPRIFIVLASLFSFTALLLFGTPGLSHAGKPTVSGPCRQCHQPQDNLVRGTLVGVSDQFKTVQVAVGSLVWVVKYGDDTSVKGAQNIHAIPKDKEIGITFTGGEKNPYAVNISIKPPATVPPEKLVSLEEMARLVEMGPERGNYVLFDSRPAPKCTEGQLPFAVSFPFDKFDKLKDSLLPKEKDKLIIFYCGGVT